MYKLDSQNSLKQIQHAHRIATIIIRKYGAAYLPVLVRLDNEKKKAEEIERILLSAVAEYS